MDTWDTQLTINSDLFMSDRSHEEVKRSPAYVRFGFFTLIKDDQPKKHQSEQG